MSTLLLAACDSVYFARFGPAFLNSALHHGNRVHVHLIDPDGPVPPDGDGVSYTAERGAPVDRTYFAMSRFLVARFVRRTQPQPHDRLMILDIDSIVRRRLEAPDVPVGLYRRAPKGDTEWRRKAHETLATVVSFGPGGEPFFEQLEQHLRASPLDWYADQVALSLTYDAFMDALPVHDFAQDTDLMDWTFADASAIWSAKGPRKFEDPRYLAALAYWSDPVAQETTQAAAAPEAW